MFVNGVLVVEVADDSGLNGSKLGKKELKNSQLIHDRKRLVETGLRREERTQRLL